MIRSGPSGLSPHGGPFDFSSGSGKTAGPGWSQCWGQLVREHMKQKETRQLDMKAEMVNGILHASIDAFTPDERFENGMKSKLNITGPTPMSPRTTRLRSPRRLPSFEQRQKLRASGALAAACREFEIWPKF